jgi:hypothetical protein
VGTEMKPRIKHPEPAPRPFWAVSVHSKSGIAHMVDVVRNEPIDGEHYSHCGLYFFGYELYSAGSSGIGAPRCKRCMASKEKDNE